MNIQIQNMYLPGEDLHCIPMDEGIIQEQNPCSAFPGGASNIMGYLSVQDLKNCRLVNRQWNDEASKCLQERVKVLLTSEQRVDKFMSEFKNNRNFFTNFQLGPFMSMKSLEIRTFFQLFGPYIKSLILQKTNCKAQDLREVLFRLAPNIRELSLCGTVPGGSDFTNNMQNYERRICPDIEVLKLNLTMVEGVGVIQNFLGELLSISPNVQTIIIPQNANKEFLRLFFNVLLLSRNFVLSKLSCADALLSVTNLQTQLLEAKAFPLTHLNMQLLQNVTLESLLSLLSSLSNTLISLRLHFHLTQFKELPSAVSLVKLKELTLEEYKGSLRFIVGLPAIRQLTIFMASFEELEDVFPTSDTSYHFWASDTMKKFRPVIRIPGRCTLACVHKMAKSFPNLVSITLQGLSDETLQLIFTSFPNLEELNATGILTDEGITGISNEAVQKVGLHHLVNQYSSQSSRHHQNPSISDLSRLRILGLHSPRITDVSIYLGVILCKGIRSLSLERLGITDSSIYAIMEQLDLHHCSITRCTRLSEPGLKLVQERMRGRQLTIVYNKRAFQL